MESVDTFVGDSTESETESRIINDVKYHNQNVQMSNRLSAQTTFINHERKRSITSNVSNSDNVMSRSSFSSNDDGPNMPRRPNPQEVRRFGFCFFPIHLCLCLFVYMYCKDKVIVVVVVVYDDNDEWNFKVCLCFLFFHAYFSSSFRLYLSRA